MDLNLLTTGAATPMDWAQWLVENQALLMATIVAVGGLATALLKVWASLKQARSGLNAVVEAVEKNEIQEALGQVSAAAKQIKADVKALEQTMSPGQRAEIKTAIDHARDKWWEQRSYMKSKLQAKAVKP